MTLEPEKKAKLDEALLDSLLHEIYVGDPREQQRIARVIDELNVQAARPSSPDTIAHRNVWRRVVSITVAATLLLAAGYGLMQMTSSNTAYAAVMRSLEAQSATRAYRIRMVHQRPAWGTREVISDLYLNDRDQFVVRHPSLPRFGDVWIGGDAKNRWIVPRVGPAFTGVEETVGGWLMRKDVPTPFLHISTILQRMSKTYRLQMLDNVSIPHPDHPEQSFTCEHVVGLRRAANVTLPSRIELWADVETGMARRLELTWDRKPNERGPLSWTIELVGSPDLPENWFEVEGHVSPERRIIRVRSSTELDEAEQSTN